MLPFVIKIFVLSIFEWQFYTNFTVYFRLRGLFDGHWVETGVESHLSATMDGMFQLTETDTVKHPIQCENKCDS